MSFFTVAFVTYDVMLICKCETFYVVMLYLRCRGLYLGNTSMVWPWVGDGNHYHLLCLVSLYCHDRISQTYARRQLSNAEKFTQFYELKVNCKCKVLHFI